MIKYIIIFTIMAFLSNRILKAEDEEVPYLPTTTQISPTQLKALLSAIKHFESREDYSIEQKKLENYNIWINPSSAAIKVGFLPIPRPGDEKVLGGNFSYAKGTVYVISSETFKILSVYGSK